MCLLEVQPCAWITGKPSLTDKVILIRTLWSVLASIDTARVADSLANVHLGVRLPRPEDFMRDLLFVPDHRYAYWHAVAVHAFRRLG